MNPYKTMQVRVKYHECVNQYGEYIVKTLRVRSKGYPEVIFRDPDGLNVSDCAGDYVNEMDFPKAEIEVIRDAHIDRRGGWEIHCPATIIQRFVYMGKIYLDCNPGFVEPEDDDCIAVDLSEYGL